MTPTEQDKELRGLYDDEAKYVQHILSLPTEELPVHVMLRARQRQALMQQRELAARIDETEMWRATGFLPLFDADKRLTELERQQTEVMRGASHEH